MLDGAAGTYLIERGLTMGVCPEAWACDHEELIAQMHRDYVRAGAKAVYAFTFGANPVKLAEYGLEHQTEAINQKLVSIAKEAVGKDILVGGGHVAYGTASLSDGEHDVYGNKTSLRKTGEGAGGSRSGLYHHRNDAGHRPDARRDFGMQRSMRPTDSGFHDL